eukprot:NODE_1566_length_1125_cov_95.605019_g1275_i0.p1 GENE.NODE_1566_length_1125_cov_95.605019_g1275_i0~~NODE_1566_length_1125_cov_95.605019_g1275_i0.p1  ORF type:complete len:310 (+),score=42.15 NODE_1566_length_1125_cov_95.605019_g1275_i0:133-1062(+)
MTIRYLCPWVPKGPRSHVWWRCAHLLNAGVYTREPDLHGGCHSTRPSMDILSSDSSNTYFSKFLNDFYNKEELGTGCNGKVVTFRVTMILNGAQYIVKQTLAETAIERNMFGCKHHAKVCQWVSRHIVTYHDLWEEGDNPLHFFIRLEYCNNGTVATWASHLSCLCLTTVIRILHHILLAVDHIHKLKIAHLNVSLESIYVQVKIEDIVQAQPVFKLGDFEYSSEYTQELGKKDVQQLGGAMQLLVSEHEVKWTSDLFNLVVAMCSSNSLPVPFALEKLEPHLPCSCIQKDQYEIEIARLHERPVGLVG